MRIAETKKDTYEFKRDIIIGAENPRTGKIAGEKMIRWEEGAAVWGFWEGGFAPFAWAMHALHMGASTRSSWGPPENR